MSALNDHLEPDERVLYRSGSGWRALVWPLIQSLWIAVWLPIVYWAIDQGRPGVLAEYETVILSILILGIAALYAIRDAFRTTVVTERRVINKTGVFTPEIADMVHAEVERMSMSWSEFLSGWPRVVSVHGCDGRDIRLHAPLEGHALCRSIAECASVAAPERLGRRIIAAGVVRTGLAMMGSLVTVFLVFKLLWMLLDYGAATDNRLTQILFGMVWLALAMPAFLSLLVGAYLGNVVSMIVLRPILSASEARRLLATNWRVRSAEKLDSVSRALEDVFRFGLALKHKLLSRLYGEPIRLDE